MAIKNPKIFGLDINQYFADVLDKEVALRNLGVTALDLSVIYQSNTSVKDRDWRSFSALNTPIWKKLDRYHGDANRFVGLLNGRAGIDNLLFGDLDINGVLSGSAIRYRYLKSTGTNAYIALADISTSRVSAWSSSDVRANSNKEEADDNNDPFFPIQRLAKISYGSRIEIQYHNNADRGLLRFGSQNSATTRDTNGNLWVDPSVTYTDGSSTTSQSDASGRRLQTSLVPTKVEFPSEIPTTKIKIHLDGETHYLYAMKGIPLAFRGTFKSLDNIESTFESLTTQVGTILPSWKVVKANNRDSFVNYKNMSKISSFRSSRAEKRYIELYYPADLILTIKATNANIEELPVAKFSKLTEFQLYSNQIKNFPDFDTITPKLEKLYINNNPLYNSETISERKLTQEITNKLPTTLKEINMGGTFSGSIERNIFVDRFPELTHLNLNGTGVRFTHDNDDRNSANNNTCTVPNVPNTLTEFRIQYNDFRQLDETGAGEMFNNVWTSSSTSNYNLTGSYESGNKVIFNCGAGTHKLAPGAVLENNTGETGIQADTRVMRIKGNVVYVDKEFTASLTNASIKVNTQLHNENRKVYRDGMWVGRGLHANGKTYKVASRFSPNNVENLEVFDVYHNTELYASNFELVSKELIYVNLGHSKLPLPLLEDRSRLTTFDMNHNRFPNTTIDGSDDSKDTFFNSGTESTGYTAYKLNLCTALKSINCYNSSIKGPLPSFSTNPQLETLDIQYTNIYGGDQGVAKANQQYVISSNVFLGCTKLKNFYMNSKTIAKGTNSNDPTLIVDGIQSNAFADTVSLVNLVINTRNQVRGRIPSLSSLSNLESLDLEGNKFSGSMPTFVSNSKIRRIELQNNELYGTIPPLSNLPSLRELKLQQNRGGDSTGFTLLSEFSGLDNLETFYCHYNSISGLIPSFAGCPKIKSISLYDNKFSGYEEGSIASLISLKSFDISNNQLVAADIDNIIADCLASYEAQGNKRTRVTIDLRNNYVNGIKVVEDDEGNLIDAPQQHLAVSDESLETVTFLKIQAQWNFPGYN